MTDDLTKTEIKRGTDCIGVTVGFMCHDGKGNILLHKRGAKCRDEQGKWDNGGGALEFGETFEESVRREILEEYSAPVKELTFLAAYNNIREHEGRMTHWVVIMYGALIDPADVKNNEPEKIEELGWFRPDALPTPPHTVLLRNVRLAQDAGII